MLKVENKIRRYVPTFWPYFDQLRNIIDDWKKLVIRFQKIRENMSWAQ